LLALSTGSVLEWFDWNSYVLFTPFFATQFFPDKNKTAAELSALAVFAIGFIFRPLGGILLGGLADRRGRRASLTLSVSVMAGGSLIFALAPPYSAVGILAPIILIFARALQGLSTGGEFASFVAYLAEISSPRRRGMYSSFAYVTSTVGVMTATLAATAFAHIFSPGSLSTWAWRIPFFFGAMLGLYGLYLRLTLDETEIYLAALDRRVRRPTMEVLRRHPASGLRVSGFTVAATVVYYSVFIYLPTYVETTFHVAEVSVLVVSVVAQVFLIIVLVPLGMLSDRIGRKPLLITFAAGYALFSVPLWGFLGRSPWSLLFVMCAGLLLFACYGAPAPTVMAELFPTQVRSAGLGFPYAVTVAIFGGTAPYIIAWLSDHGHQYLFPWYITALSLISLVAYITSRETKGVRLQSF
jgi:MHS family alpha-ketoglutarate permease-like MFS transporter